MLILSTDNGNIEILSNCFDRDRLEELLDDRATFTAEDEQEFWHGGTNSIDNNSEYKLRFVTVVSADEFGYLSEAPVLVIMDENGVPEQMWYYPQYQVRSFLSELLENTTVTFVKL